MKLIEEIEIAVNKYLFPYRTFKVNQSVNLSPYFKHYFYGLNGIRQETKRMISCESPKCPLCNIKKA